MVSFYGDYDTTETVVIPFNAFSSDDPSISITVTDLISTDVEIYKDGSTTERNSVGHSGVAVDIDVDAVAGAHWVTIDLSDNDDAGFYIAGSRYQVMIVGVTVDGGIVNAWIGAFSIGCTLRPTTAGRTLDIQATGEVDANMTMISGDTTAADNLELQYNTTGLIGDTFPLRQDQGASISGGLAVRANMVSPVTVIAGSEQNIANTTASNGFYWTGDDDGGGAEFIFLCTPADTTAEPGDLHFEGYYDEPGAPKTNGASVYVYNFQTATWVLHITLTDAAADEIHDVSLTHADGAPGSGTLEGRAFVLGDVLIKFKQDSPEGGNACLLIDRMYVGFISAPITATEIVDEWETQSQADPTGFHVNVREWLDIAVTLSTNNKPDVNVNEWKDVVVTTAVPDAATTAAGLHATTNALISAAAIRAAVGLASANLDTQLGTLSTHDAAAVKTAIEAGGSSLAQILEDTGELQTDNIPGTLSMIAGYLDTEIAAIKAVTDVIPDAGALTTIGTDTARLTTERAAVLTDWINGGRLDTILDAVSGGGTTNITTETTTIESKD